MKRITEVDLEQLYQMARQLEEEGIIASELQARMRMATDHLLYAGWVGRGADHFFDEMYETLLPALSRLSEALGEATITVRKMARLFGQAQELAAAEFYKIEEE